MKRPFILIILLTLIGCNSLLAKGSKKEIYIKTKIYCDHCAKCESCKSRVESKVYELKGVKVVELDPAKETIFVVYNSKAVNEKAIRQQIVSAGYDADDLKATEAQVAKLDGCCQK